MIRVAAVGDVHFGLDSAGRLLKHVDDIAERADVLLLAGDLTQAGTVEEAQVLANDLARAPFPIVAVLGNHDYHKEQEAGITQTLERAGIKVLEGNSLRINIRGEELGVAGVKGFGGGFPGACGSEFGEFEMKQFMRLTKANAATLRQHLLAMDCPYKVALMHYSPIEDTLAGERREIFPFLGSYLLAEAVDGTDTDVIFHGHAHRGVEKGVTFGGVPVRNVAQPVIRHVCHIYTLQKDGIAMETSGFSPYLPAEGHA